MALDTYGNELEIGDTIVFSWGGTLSKGIIEQSRRVKGYSRRAELIVRPLGRGGEAYETTAKVKDSTSTVKI